MSCESILSLIGGAFIGMLVANLVVIPLFEQWRGKRHVRSHWKRDVTDRIVTDAYDDELAKLTRGNSD